MEWSFILQIGLPIVLMAFVAEYFDSTLGMGYGTSLTPILLLLGYQPMQIVPCILLSELFTGIFAGLIHNKMGNVQLFTGIKPDFRNSQLNFISSLKSYLPKDLKIALLIAMCSIVGTVAAVIIAVSLPKFYVKLYIGILILTMGLLILITSKKVFKFSWKKIIGLSVVASFNKGMSGGGYGPVVTSGQLLSGVDGKSAIGITSFAEGLTCLVGLIMYISMNQVIDWTLAPFLVVGGMLSVPLSGITVKRMKTEKLRVIIGIVTVGLGLLALGKIFIK
ncbi:MAG: sulfite exporter TauE/SafE family protein [Candidatus Cloacimonetes bacterium]|nr:sulfite exporter TauE/SafE family protein [Candidatus Cloacimonadota bacterium]